MPAATLAAAASALMLVRTIVLDDRDIDASWDGPHQTALTLIPRPEIVNGLRPNGLVRDC